MDIVQTIAEHVTRTRYEDCPHEALLTSKLSILDALGTAMAGHDAQGCTPVLRLVRGWGGRREAGLALAELCGGVSGRELLATFTVATDFVARLNEATPAGVDAALALAEDDGVRSEEIREVTVTVGRYHHNLLVGRVQVAADDGYDALHGVLATRVAVTFESGRRAERFVPFPRGHFRSPMTPQEPIEKFSSNAWFARERGLGGIDPGRVVDTVMGLEKVEDVTEILQFLKPRARRAPVAEGHAGGRRGRRGRDEEAVRHG